MTKQEWQVAESFLKSLGIKPRIVESKDGQGNLKGLVVWFSADNVKFTVDFGEEKQAEAPKIGRKKFR